MIVIGRSLGQKKKLFADWSIPVPPEFTEGAPVTLRQLIEKIVRVEVAGFQQRQQDRQFIRVLTSRQIDEGTAAGKIESGSTEVPVQEVDPDSAVATALQAFEDGLYLVAIDGTEQRSLDQQVYVNEESQVAFIRLTLLAGG